MAGPGGGPPRKSHTKSRKGCRTCKVRHIRCDENFPQCRNCTKHSVRCDYMDVSKAGEESAKGSRPPELLTSQELQNVLDNWRITGQSPLVELRKSDTSYWRRFSTIDLRLVHHITTLSSDLYRRGYSTCTPWTPKMSNFISVALSNDFAMSALLAFSATHMSWQTKNNDTEHLAYHHRDIAIKGLHEALGTFSEQISEAVLTASILLAWQAKDWQSWVSLQQGVSTVMGAMRQWIHQSELAKFLESQRVLARTRTPSTPSLSGLPPQQPATDDVQRLEQMITALHNLRLRLSSFSDLVEHVDDALGYVEQVQQDYPTASPTKAFDTLLRLRSIVFWIPTATLRPEASDLGALAMMAHFYALALVLEPLFPECGGLYLGNMCLDPLEKVCQMMQGRSAAVPHDTTLQTALSMLDIPMQVAHAYRSSRRAITSPAAPYRYSVPTAPPPSAYSTQGYDLPSPPDLARQHSYQSVSMQGLSHAYQSPYTPSSFQSSVPSRHDSMTSRSQGDPRHSGSSSLHNIASPQHSGSDHAPTNVDYFTGSSGFTVVPSYSGMSDYQNRFVQAPTLSQLWT